MNKKIKKLIIIEHPYQVGHFKKYFEENNFSENFHVLALHPKAQVLLKSKNINFLNTKDFFKKEDHESILKKGTEIADFLKKDFLLSDSLGVKNAYKSDFFRIFHHHYLNYCLSIISIIHNAVTKYNPSELILPEKCYPENINRFDLNTSLVGFIGALYSKTNKLEFKNEGAIAKKALKKRVLKSFIHRSIFNAQIILMRIFSSNKKIIWATSASYNIPRLVEIFKKEISPSFIIGISRPRTIEKILSLFTGKNWNFYDFPPPAPFKKTKNFLKNYEKLILPLEANIKLNPELFSYNNISLINLVLDFFSNGLKNEILKTFNGSFAFDKVTSIKRPFLVISNHASSYHYAIGEQCKSKKIKAFLVSHGTHVLSKDVLAKGIWQDHASYMFLSDFPFISVQTPQSLNFLNSIKDLPSIPLKTGPLIFSEQKNKEESLKIKKKLFPNNYKNKIVLHAATPYSWQYFLPYVNLSLDEYVESINDIIKAIDEIENLYLVIRLRLKTFPGMSIDEIKSLFIKSKSYEIRHDGEFDDFLSSCDLLISYSSTTIEEALNSKKPVLQYDPYSRYSHIEALDMQDNNSDELSTIYYSKSKKDLITNLKWLKNNHLEKESLNLTLSWEAHKLEFDKNWIYKIINN